jgi:PAS domain S-box-containing protein
LGAQLDADGSLLAQSTLFNDPCFSSAIDTACDKSQVIQFRLGKDSDLAQFLTLRERGFGDTPSLAVLGPIAPQNQPVISIFMFGINPRRPYDREYQQFIQTLVSVISSAFASLEAKKASERTEEAVQQEHRARSMVDASPVGSFLMKIDGTLLYVNSSWYDITGYDPAEGFHAMSWLSVINDDDHSKMAEEWHKLSVEKQSRSFELRLKKQWQYTGSHTGDFRTGATYILVSALHQSIGNEEFVTGAITDISQQKWSEEAQMMQKDEALALKRAQEK